MKAEADQEEVGRVPTAAAGVTRMGAVGSVECCERRMAVVVEVVRGENTVGALEVANMCR